MGVVHQVGVDFAGGGRGGVAQSLADVEEGNSLEGGDGGEGVAQAVKGNPGQIIFPHEPGEGQGQGVGGVGQTFVVQHYELTGLFQPALPEQPLLPLVRPYTDERFLVSFWTMVAPKAVRASLTDSSCR